MKKNSLWLNRGLRAFTGRHVKCADCKWNTSAPIDGRCKPCHEKRQRAKADRPS